MVADMESLGAAPSPTLPGVGCTGEQGAEPGVTLDREPFLLFHQGGLDALLVPPRLFPQIEDDVGELRAAAFREVSPFAPLEKDLDGRDSHYWHLLVCEHGNQRLLGAQRLSFSRWQQPDWGSKQSYLEHCYPGFQGCFAAQELTYLEVGRVFVAPTCRNDFRILPSLMRASGLLARDTGHRYIVGLMSYRFVKADQEADWQFLNQIRLPPFSIDLPVPAARHPLETPINRGQIMPGLSDQLPADADLDALAKLLRKESGTSFQLPGLIRIYSRFTRAKVAGLSIARDFNQIVEILMCNDLEDHSTGALHPGLLIPHKQPWLNELRYLHGDS